MGSVPPLVSHGVTQDAPPAAAALRQSIA